MKYTGPSIIASKRLVRIIVCLWMLAAIASCAPKHSLHRNYKKQKRKCSDCPSFTQCQTVSTPTYARYQTA